MISDAIMLVAAALLATFYPLATIISAIRQSRGRTAKK